VCFNAAQRSSQADKSPGQLAGGRVASDGPELLGGTAGGDSSAQNPVQASQIVDHRR
jgi:hypothetical protein